MGSASFEFSFAPDALLKRRHPILSVPFDSGPGVRFICSPTPLETLPSGAPVWLVVFFFTLGKPSRAIYELGFWIPFQVFKPNNQPLLRSHPIPSHITGSSPPPTATCSAPLNPPARRSSERVDTGLFVLSSKR